MMCAKDTRRRALIWLFALCAALGLFLSLTATARASETVPYLDWNETTKAMESKTCEDYAAVTSDLTAWGEGWHVVNSGATISDRITVTGNVHLILCDGATLTAPQGITVNEGNSLTIYGQSGGTGALITGSDSMEGNAAGIGISADGMTTSGTITINGGTVTATGDGAGIGGDGATVQINGGTVTANGPAGIGGNTIVIYGGAVTAEGSTGIGNATGDATITLSWTDKSDSITASSYSGTVTLEKDFVIDGQSKVLTAADFWGESNGTNQETGDPADVNGEKIVPFVTISPATLTAAPTAAENLTYNGEEQALVSAGDAEGGTVQYKLGSDGAYSEAIPAAKDAGTYAVSYKVVGDDTHTDTEEASVSVTIAPIVAELEWDDTPLTYNGEPQAPWAKVSNTVNWDTVWATVDGEQTDVGTYTATATALDSANYKLPDPAPTVTFSIAKAKLPVTANMNGKTYGEEDPELTYSVEGNSSGSVTMDTGGGDSGSGGGSDSGGDSGSTFQFTGVLTREPGENAGTYAITQGTLALDPNTAEAKNYEIEFTGANFDIYPKTVENPAVTVGDNDGAGWTYAGTAIEPPVTVLYNDGENEGIELPSTEYEAAYADNVNAGTATVTVTFKQGNYSFVDENYDTLNPVAIEFEIAKKPVTVTPDAQSKTYGDADPDLTATVEGAVGSDTINYTLSRAEGEDVGEYAVAVTPGDNPNYEVKAVKGKFTISKASVTVTPDAQSKTYGDADPDLTATVEGAVGCDTINYTLSRAEGENVGKYVVTVTPGDNPNYDVTATNGVFTINKKAVTVTADAKSKVYGADDPELTAAVDGAVGNDTIHYTLSRAEGEDAGEYDITVTPGSNPNYDVTAKGGTFTIGKRNVTVSGIAAEDKPYDGTTDATLNYDNVTFDGIVGGDELTVTAAGTFESADAGENKAVAISGLTLGGADAGNYVLVKSETFVTTEGSGAYTGTHFKIECEDGGDSDGFFLGNNDAKKATISALNGEKIAKLELTRGWYSAEATYATAGERTIDGNTITFTGVDASSVTLSAVGNHVQIKQVIIYYTASGAGAASVQATISPKAATVTADDKSKVYGAEDPELTATVEGAVDGETIGYALSRAEGKDAGEYDITVTPGDNPNYDVTAVNGKFTIAKKTATVTANDASKAYGDADPALTATVEGAVGSDTINYALSRAEGGGVGEYDITVTPGSNPNYDVTATGGTFTIGKRNVTVSGIAADNKPYDGTTDATLNYDNVTFDGIVDGDELTVTATGTFESAEVGDGKTVTISNLTLGGANVANYELADSGQQSETTANITPNELNVTAQGYSGTYDGQPHSITVTAPDNVSVTYSESENGTYGEQNPAYTDAGNYTVYYKATKVGATDANGSATVTISQKPVTVSGIAAANKPYDGTTNATLNYDNVTFDGIVDGDALTVTAIGTFDSAEVGDGKTVTLANLTLGGA
ncbi:MAG: hypothetical protein IKN96_07290, partial [Oscillibacter sp.]|nr:hypothetical protein [Oscillibacter sp.]